MGGGGGGLFFHFFTLQMGEVGEGSEFSSHTNGGVGIISLFKKGRDTISLLSQ